MSNILLNTATEEKKEVYQLARLSPEAINNQWDSIKEALQNSLPPLAGKANEERMNNILRALLGEELECWVLLIDDETYAIGTTQLLTDFASGVKSLLIYSLYAYEPLSYKVWFQLLLQIQTKAREQGAIKIVAYSDNERALALIDSLGGWTNIRFIEIDI